MIMIAVLHEVLLMVILLMLLPLINKDWFSRHPEFGGTFVRNTLQSKVLRNATTSTLLQHSECSKSPNKCYHFKHAPKIQNANILPLTKIGRLPKKVATRLQFLFLMLGNHDSLYFAIIPLTPSATRTIILGTPKDSPRFGQKKGKLLFTCHYSPVTIHWYYSPLLFTPKFCLFKGGCPLYLK